MVEAGDDHPGVPWCACFIIISVFSNGTWLTREPPSRFFFQTVSNQTQILNFTRCHFNTCTVFAICSERTISNFLASGHQPIPVRFIWNVFFARKMHSTSEFAMIVLSKCVLQAGFVKVA